MEKFELSVVTTTYNQEDYIEKCIKSILEQKTSFKFQLIVSNDNSSDNTLEILNKYKKIYKDKLTVINRENNLGPMLNFIETLNSVHTKYVALCDGDDYWTDMHKLQKQYDFLEKHKDYYISFHKTSIFFGENDERNVVYPLNVKSDLTLSDLLRENYIPANTVVYRWKYLKKDSLKNEFPNDIVPGDYFLHLMHAKLGKINFINETMSVYRRQEQGMWYLTTQPNKQNLFYFKYGKKYFNFFKQSEIKLNIPDAFKEQKRWVLKNYIKVIIKKRKINMLLDILYSEFDNDYWTFNIALSELNKLDKLFYFFVKKYYLYTLRRDRYENKK